MKPKAEEMEQSVSQCNGREDSANRAQENGHKEINPSTGQAYKIKAKGQGLLCGHVNQYSVFILDARQAGCGDVDVVIKGPSKATISLVEEAEAMYRVHYVVTIPGDYFIEIRFNGDYIPGSPFPLYIGVDRSGTNSIAGSVLSLENSDTVDVNESKSGLLAPPSTILKREKTPSSLLRAIVHSPSGKPLKAKLIQKINKKFAVTFPHPEVGTYTVNVIHTVTKKSISGCPFKVHIHELADEGDLRVTGKALERCRLGETGIVRFQSSGILDASKLIVAFEGSSLVSLRALQSDGASIDFLFIPKKAGVLKMHAYYQGVFLPGSPFDIRVTNRSAMTRYLDPIPLNGNESHIKVTAWVGFGQNNPLRTIVLSPSLTKVEHAITPFAVGCFELSFPAKETGKYRAELSTDFQDDPIVFFLTNHSAVSNDESTDVIVDYQQEGVIMTSYSLIVRALAGPVHALSVEFKGPGKVEIVRVEEQDQIRITYRAHAPGTYGFAVFKEGVPVKGSPWPFLIHDVN